MSDSAVEADIVESVSTEYSIQSQVLSRLLVSDSISTADKNELEAVEECYRIQECRNAVEEELQAAAESDAYSLVDSDGVVFWVDSYDGFGAYIHTGDGGTHYVSVQRLRNEFEFVEQ